MSHIFHSEIILPSSYVSSSPNVTSPKVRSQMSVSKQSGANLCKFRSFLSNFELNFLKSEEFVLYENWNTADFRCTLSIGGGIFQKFFQEFKFRFSIQYTDHFTFRQCAQSISHNINQDLRFKKLFSVSL
jgi:hypothetical protein